MTTMARKACTLLLLVAGGVLAHPDFDEHIVLLDAEIRERPDDAALYLRRADLYRRHGDLAAASADFATARRIDPQLADMDWREARILADAGRWHDAEVLLSNYLLRFPSDPDALQTRGAMRSRLGRHGDAAVDYQAAIAVGERPAPSLFTQGAVEWLAASPPQLDAAQVLLGDGLARFPGEVSLLGMAADLALARSQLEQAGHLLAGAPAGFARLPQWAWRNALLACLDGTAGGAAALGELALRPRNGAGRAGTWQPPDLPPGDPGSKSWCRQLAASSLESAILGHLVPD